MGWQAVGFLAESSNSNLKISPVSGEFNALSTVSSFVAGEGDAGLCDLAAIGSSGLHLLHVYPLIQQDFKSSYYKPDFEESSSALRESCKGYRFTKKKRGSLLQCKKWDDIVLQTDSNQNCGFEEKVCWTKRFLDQKLKGAWSTQVRNVERGQQTGWASDWLTFVFDVDTEAFQALVWSWLSCDIFSWDGEPRRI